MSDNRLLINTDGANFQAQAVLAVVRDMLGEDFEPSWSTDLGEYLAEPRLARFDNNRVAGYVIWMPDSRACAWMGPEGWRQINITFYQHGVSDQIVVNGWRKAYREDLPPTRHDMPDVEEMHRRQIFEQHEIVPAAEYIIHLLTEFWEEGNT
ncbi:hypothetical protein D869_gp145 [Caulobacter phage CcrRogue]|uniref:Uncharacterized protein n=1 Tax=Caulobacter phage CcrRogue TaxID=2927986 RepID=K4JNG2_9CAUD|nr:hypothetical protein D869_gp145 [Caulobacter phage CcrRogue]AFU86769.1 hypothetical protein CcrRogue_gp287 [Caulobacter phage CcrRogue]